jgi:hypothetical protein
MMLHAQKASSEEMSGLPPVVHPRPANAEAPAILFPASLQEGQQALAAGALAEEAGEPGYLARASPRDEDAQLARCQSGILAKAPPQGPGTLQDDLGTRPGVW